MEKEAHDNGVQTVVEFHLPPSFNNGEISNEIIEIEEEKDDEVDENNGDNNKRRENSNGGDVYVAVGKDDLEVLKWVLAHALAPGDRVNLIHIYPPISYISTPVGKLWVGQMSPEQAKVYAIEEHTKRRNLLHKYIRLCVENKVNLDTILIESSETTKAISDLIPILNMTSLVMGTKHPPSSRRRLIKGSSKGTTIQKNAPDYCKVTLVYTGKKNVNIEGKMMYSPSSFLTSNDKHTKVNRQKHTRNNMECACFPVKFY